MHGLQPLEGKFIEKLLKEEVPVAIYLVNGIKLQGKIEAYDSAVLLLKNTFSQAVFKHAISTIVPMRKVELEGVGEEG